MNQHPSSPVFSDPNPGVPELNTTNDRDLAAMCDDGGPLCDVDTEPFPGVNDYVRISDGEFAARPFAGGAADLSTDGAECLVPAVEDLSAELHTRAQRNHRHDYPHDNAVTPLTEVETVAHLAGEDIGRMMVQVDATMREILTLVRDNAELRREVSAIRQDVRNLRATVRANAAPVKY